MTEILTVGHSTRSIDDFLALLRAHEVSALVDVRTLPRSKRSPWFDAEALARALRSTGIAWRHEPRLGGLRTAWPDSTNTAIGEALRGYADHMGTASFGEALDELVAAAERARTVVMCAEADPARCHRAMLSDALVARGVPVGHVIDAAEPHPHVMSRYALVEDERVSYPGQPRLLD